MKRRGLLPVRGWGSGHKGQGRGSEGNVRPPTVSCFRSRSLSLCIFLLDGTADAAWTLFFPSCRISFSFFYSLNVFSISKKKNVIIVKQHGVRFECIDNRYLYIDNTYSGQAVEISIATSTPNTLSISFDCSLSLSSCRGYFAGVLDAHVGCGAGVYVCMPSVVLHDRQINAQLK